MGISVNHLIKSIGNPGTLILNDLSFDIPDGQFVSLTGRSGSGKSTLLYLMSGLDSVTSGSVIVDGADLSQMNSKARSQFRNQKLGFVFQFNYLIAELSVLENILLPAKRFHEEVLRKPIALAILEKVGLIEKTHRLPRQLSGGEEQRVALARSLVMEPKYLFADEPTGALDTANGEIVMTILRDAHQNQKTTIVLVTHEPDYAKRAERQIHLSDGVIISDHLLLKK